MKAEIVAIGSELTCGARLDTNSQWLSCELESLGFTVQRHTTVADAHDAMVQTFRDAASRSRVVLITGGLGPTLDDITRETLAEAFGQSLVQDDTAVRHIEALFQKRGRVMPERNKVQALRPEAAESLHNAHGTAPGILLNTSNRQCTIAVMPGVPAEMRNMFHDQVVPRLPANPVTVKRTVIRTFGYGESDTERLLGDLTARGRNPEVGITASDAVISLSITARAGSDEECDLLTQAAREQIQDRLGKAVYAEGDAELYEIVAGQLVERNLKVALLEGPTTGGLIGQWLTENDTVAQCVAYSRLYPTRQAMGAVGEEWDLAMRQESQRLLQNQTADYVLWSSPTELEEDAGIRKQHGSVTVMGAGLDQTHDVSMTGNLSIFRGRAARAALNHLRLHLIGNQ